MEVGTATNKGNQGADWTLLHEGRLPEYYMSKEDARAKGWNARQMNLAERLPGIMIGGDVFRNAERKLPDSPGRVWYEADINYISGPRNS